MPGAPSIRFFLANGWETTNPKIEPRPRIQTEAARGFNPGKNPSTPNLMCRVRGASHVHANEGASALKGHDRGTPGSRAATAATIAPGFSPEGRFAPPETLGAPGLDLETRETTNPKNRTRPRTQTEAGRGFNPGKNPSTPNLMCRVPGASRVQARVPSRALATCRPATSNRRTRGLGIVFQYGTGFLDPSKELANRLRNCGTFLN
jgi:hypothetical protein